LYAFRLDSNTDVTFYSDRARHPGPVLREREERVFTIGPALEAQAIGRVHRLGQKRNVEIVRFIMEDSVESRMRKMLKKKYGIASVGDDDDDDNDDDDGDKKPAAKVNNGVMVGSIRYDKAAVMGEEFDLLYGVGKAASARRRRRRKTENDDGGAGVVPVADVEITL
jgi:hypothetical protein